MVVVLLHHDYRYESDSVVGVLCHAIVVLDLLSALDDVDDRIDIFFDYLTLSLVEYKRIVPEQ